MNNDLPEKQDDLYVGSEKCSFKSYFAKIRFKKS